MFTVAEMLVGEFTVTELIVIPAPKLTTLVP
jgi:hypothetical protein